MILRIRGKKLASNIRDKLLRGCKRTVSYTEPMDIPIERIPLEKYDGKILYDVEIKERDPMKKMSRLHYVGYSDRFDVWVSDGDKCPIAKVTRPYVPSESSFEDRLNIFKDDFIDNVKRSLWSHTNSDPACKFEVKGQIKMYLIILQASVNK